MKNLSKQSKLEIPFTFYNSETNEDIDCIVQVLHYLKVKGDPYTWDSDLDYYGYEEIEYELQDTQGKELTVTIDTKLDDLVKMQIREYFENERE